MRKFFASLMAFFASLFAGGMVAQLLAEWTNATEEYILVFILTVLVAVVVTVPLFVAQFFSRRAVNMTAFMCLAVFIVLGGAMAALTLIESDGTRPEKDAAIIAGLVLPGVLIILVQWLIVRGMLPSAYAVQFGRSAPRP